MGIKYIKNIWFHLRKIQTHRKWVKHYCYAIGLYKQGLLHDLSKYSPVEFWEGVKYYQGDSSPIDAAKKDKGYSMAWFHHRGRNYHHYEMWQDDFDHGGKPLIMPYKYFAEMVCDYLAAGRAYNGVNFRFSKELAWWEKKRVACAMPDRQIAALDYIFAALADHETNFMSDGVHGTKVVDEIFANGYGRELIHNAYYQFINMSDDEFEQTWRKPECGD